MKEKSTDYLELLTALGEGFRGSLQSNKEI